MTACGLALVHGLAVEVAEDVACSRSTSMEGVHSGRRRGGGPESALMAGAVDVRRIVAKSNSCTRSVARLAAARATALISISPRPSGIRQAAVRRARGRFSSTPRAALLSKTPQPRQTGSRLRMTLQREPRPFKAAPRSGAAQPISCTATWKNVR